MEGIKVSDETFVLVVNSRELKILFASIGDTSTTQREDFLKSEGIIMPMNAWEEMPIYERIADLVKGRK